MTTLAQGNAAKIQKLLDDGGGYADLYRTIEAGPSGQRADLLVGRIRCLIWGPHDFSIVDMGTGYQAGYARGIRGWWSVTQDLDGIHQWMGYASSLAVGVDIVVNGEHAALGRHDSRRISPGRLVKREQDCT